MNARSLLLLATISKAVLLTGCTEGTDADDQLENALFLLNLPANRWIKYHELPAGDWWRKGHAGLAYDSTRGSLLVFGSDTHGDGWDNVVHEFIPRQRAWVHHGVDAHPDTYKINSDGYRVAGGMDVMPWAMHTYDGVDYDPALDSLVVVASPNHNPVNREWPNPEYRPVWIYNLDNRKWSIFDDGIRITPPNFFGAATAFDSTDNSLYICRAGLWRLNLTKGEFVKLGSAPKCLHRTMAFDSWRRHLYVFGSYGGTSRITRVDTRLISENPINWEEHKPGGDYCPPYSSVPVAFDENTGVFLLVVNDQKHTTDNKVPNTATTFIYNPETNIYTELIGTRLPGERLNFMMAWDKVHEAFFLLTGNLNDGITVWALRLDPNQVNFQSDP